MKWEKHTQFVGGVPFTSFEPVPTASDGPPNFDGGVRTDDMPPPPRPREYREPGGWVTVEYEDGASWMWPGLVR